MATRASLRNKGQLTLPSEVKAALKVRDGDELEFEITPDGVLIRGLRLIPTDQAWFWTEEWQAGERAASEDIAAGRVTHFDGDDDFLASLGG